MTLQMNEDGKPSVSTVIEIRAVTLVAEVSIQDVALNNAADEDFKLRTDVPNCTKVWLQDARNLDYVWLDGKAVPP